MSSAPCPSRCTLLVELVIVSISPVPKVAPGPVLYIQTDGSTPVPAGPLKSSDQTRDHAPPLCTDGAAAAVAGTSATAIAMKDRMVRTDSERLMASPPMLGCARGWD